MNKSDLIQLTRIPSHCDCCGKKVPDIIGPVEQGAYKWLCQTCFNLPFVYLPGRKYISKFEKGIIKKWDLSKLPQKQLKIFLVEPNYYTTYPPLGLLKLAAYHRNRGDKIELMRVNGKKRIDPKKREPDLIYVTSLFTWAWDKVWEVIRYYRFHFPKSKIILGGIYASILPDHAALSGAHIIHVGLIDELEEILPAYDLIPEWKTSIFFASRGCVRRCSFCIVPKLEGRIKSQMSNLSKFVSPKHKQAILWDNNILATPNFEKIAKELIELKIWVDFNQGLDARLVNYDNAVLLKQIKQKMLHLAYDKKAAKHGVKKAIDILKETGFRGKRIIFYTLYNHRDDPDDFFRRVKELLLWGVVSYPMRFEPLNSLQKNQYVSPNWSKDELEMVADARRVMGKAGAFPPYPRLVKKFEESDNFIEAFTLDRPFMKNQKILAEVW